MSIPNDGSKPAGGPAWPSSGLVLGGLWFKPEDPRQVHCLECGEKLTGLCRWFVLPTPTAPTLVMVFPHECPECKTILTPAQTTVILPGRPS